MFSLLIITTLLLQTSAIKWQSNNTPCYNKMLCLLLPRQNNLLHKTICSERLNLSWNGNGKFPSHIANYSPMHAGGFDKIAYINAKIANSDHESDANIGNRNSKTLIVVATLTSISEEADHPGTVYELKKGLNLIGSSHTNHCVVTDLGISGIHCLLEISKDSSVAFIEDLRSTNASYIQEIQLLPDKLYQLSEGNIVRLAQTSFKFNWIKDGNENQLTLKDQDSKNALADSLAASKNLGKKYGRSGAKEGSPEKLEIISTSDDDDILPPKGNLLKSARKTSNRNPVKKLECKDPVKDSLAFNKKTDEFISSESDAPVEVSKKSKNSHISNRNKKMLSSDDETGSPHSPATYRPNKGDTDDDLYFGTIFDID